MDKKIAVITGGSRGLGRNMALALARKGADVVITFRAREDEAHSLLREVKEAGGKGVALRLDVGDTASFTGFTSELSSALKAQWNRTDFDLLVHNAGQGVFRPFAQMDESAFDDLYRVHFKGPYFLTQKLLPLLKDGGRILHISSGLTRRSQAGYSAYASMKGGVEVMSRYLAKELGARGITVNTLAPGPIETDFNGGAVRDTPALNAQLASITTLGRVGLPDDIGGMAAALLLGDTGWMTGERVEASGGMAI